MYERKLLRWEKIFVLANIKTYILTPGTHDYALPGMGGWVFLKAKDKEGKLNGTPWSRCRFGVLLILLSSTRINN